MMIGKLAPLKHPTENKALPQAERAEIQRAAEGLEATLLQQMLSAMQKAQLQGGFFSGSDGEGGDGASGTHQTTFELMLSKALAEGGPLGLADKIADELIRERQPRTSTAAGPSISSKKVHDVAQGGSFWAEKLSAARTLAGPREPEAGREVGPRVGATDAGRPRNSEENER